MYHNIIKATFHGSKYMQYVNVTLLHTHTYTHCKFVRTSDP